MNKEEEIAIAKAECRHNFRCMMNSAIHDMESSRDEDKDPTDVFIEHQKDWQQAMKQLEQLENSHSDNP